MLVPDLNSLTPLKTVKPTPESTVAGAKDTAALKEVAKDFEAAFIAQMLTHSGLAESLTSGEGKMASAFGSFYVEQLAERMADQGGIGMADSIYRQLERYGAAGETS
ncbi:hypothetical protein GCM10009069_10570 [Algimonas arctica]|uniref:Flagellar protein FlgJ N-terminal domain-containing protein n=1 Tax=Algimonas arctica TaxID=1479486 RepID=A0A8J3CR22_9PROT|nr:rod-binding protein [Algimonas arctica]GHA89382.1 hypothetical protein GCM10009069_10570 [Algimonas arctica]